MLWHCRLGVRKSILSVKIELWGVVWSKVQIVCVWSSWSRLLARRRVTHSSTNRARRGLTSFVRRTPLTTTPCLQRLQRVSREGPRCAGAEQGGWSGVWWRRWRPSRRVCSVDHPSIPPLRSATFWRQMSPPRRARVTWPPAVQAAPFLQDQDLDLKINTENTAGHRNIYSRTVPTPLPGGRQHCVIPIPCGTCVPVAASLVANCYILRLPYLYLTGITTDITRNFQRQTYSNNFFRRAQTILRH